MWHNFRKKIVSLLHFLSGKTTRQLTGQVDELKTNQGEIKSNLNEIKAHLDELKAGQDELKAGQDGLKAGQEMAIDTISRGSAMIINSQNQILQRIDDLEAKIKEIKKKGKIEEFQYRK